MILSESPILTKAQKKASYFAENFRKKLIALGYPYEATENIGSLTAAIFDLYEGFCLIYQYYLPTFIDKKIFDKDKLQDMIVDLHWELDHIKRHIEDIGDNLILISNFLEKNNDKKGTKKNSERKNRGLGKKNRNGK